MSLQALANYQEQEKVQAAVSAAVGRLSAMQNSDGSYTSYEAVNSESISQVIVACAALGIDPHTDSRFVKNGKSAVDALLTFYNSRTFNAAQSYQKVYGCKYESAMVRGSELLRNVKVQEQIEKG